MSINKFFLQAQSCSFIYISFMVAFALQWLHPTKPKVFTVRPLYRKCVYPCSTSLWCSEPSWVNHTLYLIGQRVKKPFCLDVLVFLMFHGTYQSGLKE